MGVRIGTGISTHEDPRVGAIEAAQAAGVGLDGGSADLVVLFASGGHMENPESTLEGVHEALRPGALVGCGAGGVLGCGAEHEEGMAVAVWAASLDGGRAQTFHAMASMHEDTVTVMGMEDLAGSRGAILLPDPFTFPTDPLLQDLATRAPGVPVIGGLASARRPDETGVLFHGDEVVDGGAVGVRFDDVELLPCVSQGATPVGPELTITEAEGNVISELAGQPALDRIRAVIEELDPVERTLIAGGLLIGLVIDGGRPEYGHGDFLVRQLMGADPVGARLRSPRRCRRVRSSGCTHATPPQPTATCRSSCACASPRSAGRRQARSRSRATDAAARCSDRGPRRGRAVGGAGRRAVGGVLRGRRDRPRRRGELPARVHGDGRAVRLTRAAPRRTRV